MPSPFPGMDPFIEGQQWEDFHASLIPALKDALVPTVRPRYVVQVEERVYLYHPSEGRAGHIYPDVAVAEREGIQRGDAGAAGSGGGGGPAGGGAAPPHPPPPRAGLFFPPPPPHPRGGAPPRR